MESISVKTLYEKGELSIPEDEVERILEDYGEYTFEEFDKKYKFNDVLGKMYETGYQTMVYITNKSLKDIEKHFDKLSYPLTDIFNIEASVASKVLRPVPWLA